MSEEENSFDYVVIGAGSAGCVVASRLSEDGKSTVLLLDAGPDDKTIWSKIPIGFGKMIFNPKYMWFHESEPEPYLNGRRMALAQGKMIGGSSAVNGLVYMRGLPLDYANWRDLGAEGWSYEDNLPFFRRMEHYERGATALHGGNGPVGVEKAKWVTPLSDALVKAGMAVGMPRNDDFAGQSADGIGYYDFTSWKGRRASASEAFIKPARRRSNLAIETEALVTRILFSDKTASGILYTKDGQVRRATARREVILSAGAIRSPHLLQVSGVGPAELLRENGVEVVHDLKGVGANLMDHLSVGFSYSTSSLDTINHLMGTPARQIMAALRYFAGDRRGPMALGAAQIGAMFRSGPEQMAPDIQMGMVPFLPDEKDVWKLGKTSGFRLAFYQLRPESRGDVRITSPDPMAAPRIRFNHFSSGKDADALLNAADIVRTLAAASPLQAHDVTELSPSAAFNRLLKNASSDLRRERLPLWRSGSQPLRAFCVSG